MNGDGSTPGPSPTELHIFGVCFDAVAGTTLSSQERTRIANEIAAQLATLNGVARTANTGNTVRVYVTDLDDRQRGELQVKTTLVVARTMKVAVFYLLGYAPSFAGWVTGYDSEGFAIYKMVVS